MSTQEPEHNNSGADLPLEGENPSQDPNAAFSNEGASQMSGNQYSGHQHPDHPGFQNLEDPALEAEEGSTKLSELDYEADPLARLERNNRSTKQAIAYFFAVPGLSAIIAFGLALISRSIGGPLCEAGDATWLCSQGFLLAFHILPALVCFFGLFGAAYICYEKWRTRQRWRPWIAVIWFIMPIAIGWAVNGAASLILIT